MEDEKIIELFWKREEDAITRTAEKYGGYLRRIALQVSGDPEDSEECVNDTYLKVWQAIPPHHPFTFPAFLAKITRETAIDRLRRRASKKRRGSEYTLSLEELQECAGPGVGLECEAEYRELAEAIGAYLTSLPQLQRTVFVCRYFFADPVQEIAERGGFSQAKVKSMLHRTRVGLKTYLTKEGWLE